MNESTPDLIELAREIGSEGRAFTILGRGTVSARLEGGRFAITTGSSLEAVTESDITACDASRLLPLLEHKSLPDAEVEQALLDCRGDKTAAVPGASALIHAWLNQLPGIRFAAQCLPVSINQILCSPRARDFAEKRLLPEEAALCGPASVLVPFVEGALPLAREIRERTQAFASQQCQPPRLILLQNHGVIALGETAEAVLNCLRMAGSAAAVFMGVAVLGGPNFLTPQAAKRIASKPEDSTRQRVTKT